MRPFERQSLTKQLMDIIIENIASGELPVGEKLPPEAELAEQLHVSRNTLREVLKTLETFGIIESLHGQGTFVSAMAMQRIPNIEILRMLSASHDVQSLLDARLVIEPGMARLAAERRTEEDIEAISDSIEIFLDNHHALETMFHMQLAQAAKSPVLYGYLQAVFQQMVHTPYPLVQKKLLPDYSENEIREHREILDAISDQDGNSARDLMYLHLKRRFKLMSSNDE